MVAQDLTPELLLPYLVRLMVIFLVSPLHECAHAFAAHKLGDDTAKNAGRLTIDPLSHIDPFGALFLLIFGYGWAKPVPVNPANFKHKNLDMLIVAVAGPLTNLLAAFLAMQTFYSLGPGICVWLVLSELMPARIRANGMAIALFANQFVAWGLASSFFPMVNAWGYGPVFFGFAFTGLLYFATVLFIPETKGKSLEELEHLFEAKEL